MTGGHQYASDIRLPGMLFGKVLRPPSFGATLASVDTSRCQSVPGVVVVHDGEFVGVAAPSSAGVARAGCDQGRVETRAAALRQGSLREPEVAGPPARGRSGNGSGQAAGSVRRPGIRGHPSRADLYDRLYRPCAARAASGRRPLGRREADGLDRLAAPFRRARRAHACFRSFRRAVRVIVPDTGAGYGGKHTGEAAVEAARLARAAGKPVKLVWTREEEFTWAYFRPAGVIEVKSSVQPRRHAYGLGIPQLQFRQLGDSIALRRAQPAVAFHAVQSPLRQGSYRALAATANHFARESHMDELAHAAGIDPLEFRLKNLKDPRLRAVLEAAAKAFDWGKKSEAGSRSRHRGRVRQRELHRHLRGGRRRPVNGRVQVIRATSAFECGAIVNPDHLKNQVEGAMVMGLGGALFEAIEFEDGRITNAAVFALSRAAISRHARDRSRPARPQGPSFRRRRRNADRCDRPGDRQCHLRRHRHSPSLAAAGTAGSQGLVDHCQWSLSQLPVANEQISAAFRSVGRTGLGPLDPTSRASPSL